MDISMGSNLSRYITIRSPHEALREHMLNPGKNTIGRDANCEIHVSDAAASRRHAYITYEIGANSITILDLNSTNGTFINGKKISNPHEIEVNDVLRIGRLLISFLPREVKTPRDRAKDITKSIVTGELVIESIDNYSVLLHDIATQLVNVPELSVALEKISTLVRRMIGAKECSIYILDQITETQVADIPPKIFKDLVEENAATIFGSSPEGAETRGSPSENNRGYRMVVPVQIDGKAIAIISAKKPGGAKFPFNNSDLQVVIAVSHQIALAIQRNRLEAQLLYNATHDSLTGLPNRSMLIDRLSQSLEISKRRSDYSFSVLFLDIDDFKVVNDTLGHVIGDKLLIELSSRIKKSLRTTDTLAYFGSVARFGGDEFAILLIDLKDEIDPLLVARRVCELASHPFNIDGNKLEISLSVGLTTNKLEYNNPDEMLRDADIAMYRAKESGKNRVELYDRELHSELMGQLERQNAVRTALELQEFMLHYQPIVSLESGSIVGHEALLRWHSPEHGIVPANEFIDLLVTTNLLSSVNEWVLKEACRQTVKWQKDFPSLPQLHIAVNFSSISFINHKIMQYIHEILEETKLPPGTLWIEITEEVGLNISETALDILNQLQTMGVRICIDDFGTGYSALNYLIDLPIDILKIDKSIIGRIDTVEESQKVTHAIVLLAKQLDLEIVTEGIENTTQLSLVKTLGCDYSQGYLFSEAVPADEAGKLLKRSTKWA
jgi:diguanylate cyclase (GGDEF)-like protein